MIRDMSRVGASLSATAGRETTTYTGEVLANWSRNLFETLGDLVKRPMFIDFELRDLVHHYREQLEEREHKHELNLMEHVHGAAYGYTTLGSPLFAPLSNLKSFEKTELLHRHHSQFYTADRITIAAIGVPHDVAMQLADQEFSEIVKGNVARSAAKYIGGDVRMHASGFQHTPFDKKTAHIALAWESESWQSKDVVAMCVLSALAGANKFPLTSEAPFASRIVNTRLNSNVIARGLAHHANCFTSVHSDSGLFGFYAACKPSDARELTFSLVEQATQLTAEVSSEELHRAKLVVKHAICWASDSRTALLELIGNTVAGTGTSRPISELAAKIDQITAADLTRVAERMLKTPVTVAASGDLTHLPRYDQIAAKLT